MTPPTLSSSREMNIALLPGQVTGFTLLLTPLNYSVSQLAVVFGLWEENRPLGRIFRLKGRPKTQYTDTVPDSHWPICVNFITLFHHHSFRSSKEWQVQNAEFKKKGHILWVGAGGGGVSSRRWWTDTIQAAQDETKALVIKGGALE